MIWQDYVIGIGQFIFALALLPSIFSHDKPQIHTSLITAALLVAFSIVYVTLQMFVSAASTIECAILWAILAWQKWRSTREVLPHPW